MPDPLLFYTERDAEMGQLEPLCPDCGRPMPSRVLCSACEQDRAMEQKQLAGAGSERKGLRCND
jgi:uncharacterized OB-fold protein